MRILKMSAFVGNTFCRCTGTTTVSLVSRKTSCLVHDHGRTGSISSSSKDLPMSAMGPGNVSPGLSAGEFKTLRRKSCHDLGLIRRWVQKYSSCNELRQQQRYHTPQASGTRMIVETRKVIAKIKARGEYEVPHLEISDFPETSSALHPSTETLDKHVRDWLVKYDLQTYFGSSEVFQKYLLQRGHHMPLRFYDGASIGRAAWSCYMSHVFYIVDDLIDESADGLKPAVTIPKLISILLTMLWTFPQELRSVYKVLDYLDHLPEQRRQTEELLDKTVSEAMLLQRTEYPYKLSSLGSAFREIWMMAVRERSPEYMQQLGRVILDCLFALIKEGMNRGFHNFPTFEDYLEKRRASIGTTVWASMAGHIYDAPVPDEIFFSPNVQQLLTETSSAVGLINDIYSVRKDLKSGELNAVIVLAYDLNCSLVEASRETTKELSKLYDRMRALKSKVERETSPEHLPGVRKLVKVCFSQFGGSIEFYKSSLRYT